MECNHEWFYNGTATFGGDTVEHTYMFTCSKCKHSRKCTDEEFLGLCELWGTDKVMVRKSKKLFEINLFGRTIEINMWGKAKPRE